MAIAEKAGQRTACDQRIGERGREARRPVRKGRESEGDGHAHHLPMAVRRVLAAALLDGEAPGGGDFWAWREAGGEAAGARLPCEAAAPSLDDRPAQPDDGGGLAEWARAA